MATAIVSSPSVEDIAEDVCTNLTSLDVDELSGRAGKHSCGYVEPAQAAQELLEEAIAELNCINQMPQAIGPRGGSSASPALQRAYSDRSTLRTVAVRCERDGAWP